MKSGFKAVELFNIPKQGHQPPAAEWLKKALDYVDEGKVDAKAGGQPAKKP